VTTKPISERLAGRPVTLPDGQRQRWV